MLNPDGYVYTFTKDRLWSKNRRPGEICSGVNINRNFPIYFGKGPKDQCHRSYIGSHPASEPEVQAVLEYSRDFLTEKTLMVWTLHSFGQVFFLPYAGDFERIHRYKTTMEFLAEKALHFVLPHYYRYGQVSDFVQPHHNPIGKIALSLKTNAYLHLGTIFKIISNTLTFQEEHPWIFMQKAISQLFSM